MISIILGILIIIAGASGQWVDKFTESSEGLIIVGVIAVAWGFFRLVRRKRVEEMEIKNSVNRVWNDLSDEEREKISENYLKGVTGETWEYMSEEEKKKIREDVRKDWDIKMGGNK